MPERRFAVIFYSPGTFVAEQSERPIESWDTHEAMRIAAGISERYGAKPYGFQFVTRLHAPDVPDGEGGTLRVEPREIKRSGMHFLKGTVETLTQVEARGDQRDQILINNMRGNGWSRIVTTRNGYRWTQPFEADDCLVDDDGNVTLRGDA